MPKGMPKKLKPFNDKLKDKVLTSAARIAARQSSAKEEAKNMELTTRQEEDRLRVHNALRFGMKMTEQQFLTEVQKKLQHMVADSLNDLHDSIDQIPPQNKAYAVGMLFDKLMTISGRPTNITASANVKLGSSDMSPNQVRDILKKGVKNLPNRTGPVCIHSGVYLRGVLSSRAKHPCAWTLSHQNAFPEILAIDSPVFRAFHAPQSHYLSEP